LYCSWIHKIYPLSGAQEANLYPLDVGFILLFSLRALMVHFGMNSWPWTISKV